MPSVEATHSKPLFLTLKLHYFEIIGLKSEEIKEGGFLN